MKAVLVVEMPDECCGCRFFRFADADNWDSRETVCTMSGRINEDGINTRAEWCPLKPLPEKNTWDITKNGHVTEYAEGYNDCLDEIMGENNG